MRLDRVVDYVDTNAALAEEDFWSFALAKRIRGISFAFAFMAQTVPEFILLAYTHCLLSYVKQTPQV